MTKITIPDARTLLGQTREENQRLREELAKIREVNAEQAKHIERLMENQRQAQQRMRDYQHDIRIIMARSGE